MVVFTSQLGKLFGALTLGAPQGLRIRPAQFLLYIDDLFVVHFIIIDNPVIKWRSINVNCRNQKSRPKIATSADLSRMHLLSNHAVSKMAKIRLCL